MEKTIEINRSQTLDGITITLERVELSTTKMKAYVLKTPAGKADIRWGMYSIDEKLNYEAMLSLGFPEARSLESGVQFSWENAYPVASDAQVLFFNFRLSELGVGSYGPFKFEVTLQ